jgi:hypothetical protein
VDIAELLGGRDMADVKKAVGFIVDNSDDFQRVLDLAKNLGDDGLGFLGKLPDLMTTIGDGLAQAGEQAAKAASSLVGDDGDGGAKRSLASSADTMSAAKDKLNEAAGTLSGLAEDLDKVPGLGGGAKKLTSGAGTSSGVAGELENLGGNLRDLSGILADVGEALKGLGGKLTESGGSVKTLVGG